VLQSPWGGVFCNEERQPLVHENQHRGAQKAPAPKPRQARATPDDHLLNDSSKDEPPMMGGITYRSGETHPA
jgi:hypothetical protein